MKRPRTRTTITAFCLALFCAIASASFIDGYQLKKWSDASDRVARNSKEISDIHDEAFLIGYIAGASDVGDGLTFCSPPNAKLGQLMGVVRKYLLANPEKWNQPAGLLVLEALKQAFPCK
ncbi:hypothetical protein GCM10009125_08290 [Castellaniella daejeonensis]|uniref:Rap1a immunity protein domain-containing protein n=1 Tax=Castellaniella daejeonensis TaxID=659013 RepID=A0ABP3D4V9_9BURK